MEYIDGKKQNLNGEEYLEYDENMEYDEDEYEVIEVDDDEYEKMTENQNNISIDEEENEKSQDSIYPEEISDIRLEYIFVGLLLNSPKAISRFYFEFNDCHFSDKDLLNIYKIVVFREGEAYASANAKAGFNLPSEDKGVYELTQQIKKVAAQRSYDFERVYIELKKLFILKKFYIVAPTNSVQAKILEIRKYDRYNEMTVEEVESAIEQIGVTNRLSQVVLNQDATSFLLAGDTSLSSGVPIPFPILSSVFKGLRKGETMAYAMPSNSGKSRFTTFLAAHLALIHGKKVVIISNEMSEEKIRLCLITTIINNIGIQQLHKHFISKTEGELLEFQYKADDPIKTKVDANGYVLQKEGESLKEFIKRLAKESNDFKQTIAVTEWLNNQINNCIHFIHITEHSNDDLRKIILNYYYKEGIEYIFYDTLKADTDHLGNGEEIKKTATILSNIAQKFHVFIGSSLQLLESATLPVNLTINDMSASRTVKEVLDTLCLIKQISRASIHKYEYSMTDQFTECFEIDVPKDTDVRFYACVVDKNRAGAKPTLLFRLNLAYNVWEELGYLRLKQENIEE